MGRNVGSQEEQKAAPADNQQRQGDIRPAATRDRDWQTNNLNGPGGRFCPEPPDGNPGGQCLDFGLVRCCVGTQVSS